MAVHLAFSVVVVAMSMVTQNGNPEFSPDFLGGEQFSKRLEQPTSKYIYIYVYIYITSPIFLGVKI